MRRNFSYKDLGILDITPFFKYHPSTITIPVMDFINYLMSYNSTVMDWLVGDYSANNIADVIATLFHSVNTYLGVYKIFASSGGSISLGGIPENEGIFILIFNVSGDDLTIESAEI